MFQFRLRTIFIILTVLAVFLSAAAWKVRSTLIQQRTVDELSQFAPAVRWQFGNVTYLQISVNDGSEEDQNYPPFTDQYMELIAKLPFLKELDLSDTEVTDDGLARIEDLSYLHTINLRGCPLTDKSIVPLACFPLLRRIDLGETLVTNKGLMIFSRERPDVRLYIGTDYLSHDLTPPPPPPPP